MTRHLHNLRVGVCVILAGVLPLGAQVPTVHLTPDVATDRGAQIVQPWEIVVDDGSPVSTALTLAPLETPNAIHLLSGGEWLVSFPVPVDHAGGTYLPADVVRIDGAGTWTLFLDASSAGLPLEADIDALFLDGGDGGDLIVSFGEPTTLGTTTFQPSDLARYDGSWSLELAAAGPGIPDTANVVAAHRASGETLLSFDVPTTIAAATFLPGEIAAWDGFVITTFRSDPSWPATSGLAGLSRTPLGCMDMDGDGFGAPGSEVCSGGGLTDCDDSDPWRFPGAAELCNGTDDNCSGFVDDDTSGTTASGATWYHTCRSFFRARVGGSHATGKPGRGR